MEQPGKYKLSPVVQWNSPEEMQTISCGTVEQPGKYKLSPVVQWNRPEEVQTISYGTMEQPRRNINYLLWQDGTATILQRSCLKYFLTRYTLPVLFIPPDL